MQKHRCVKFVPGCCCYLLASEPSEKCPIHSGYWEPPACRKCGRFMRYKYKATRRGKR